MANDESNANDEAVVEGSEEPEKKKPAVKGKRLTTGVRGGGGNKHDGERNGTSSTGWGCTNCCNHASRPRSR